MSQTTTVLALLLKSPKPLKKSQMKTIAAIMALGFKIGENREVRVNPYTGKSHVLEPLAVMLYDFITTRTLVCGIDFTRKDWDTARYCFCEQWPNEYFDLLD